MGKKYEKTVSRKQCSELLSKCFFSFITEKTNQTLIRYVSLLRKTKNLKLEVILP
jgi:hypothetical protein